MVELARERRGPPEPQSMSDPNDDTNRAAGTCNNPTAEAVVSGCYALLMRPTARSARLAGRRIVSATDCGKTRRAERHAVVAIRSKPVAADRCVVLIDRFPR